MPGIALKGASAIEVIGGALPKLTERGIIEPEDFPLIRHLRAVVAKDEPPGHALERVFRRRAAEAEMSEGKESSND
jgi:glycerol-3-phosphate dehydrogenase (NAD(P)+)